MHPFDLPSAHLAPAIRPDTMFNISRLVGFIERSGLKITLTHDLATAAAIFRQSGEPLSVLADPAVHAGASHRDATLALILRDGDTPVGCSVQRRVWVEHLGADMRDLSYFYGDAQRDLPKICVATPAWLDTVRNCWTVYSCAFHVHKAARTPRPGLTAALIRLAHLLALAEWEWSWLICRCKTGILHRHVFDTYGFEIASNGVWLLGDGADPEDHPHWLCGASRHFFTLQAIHPHYGDPGKSLVVAPQLRRATAATEAAE